MASSCSAWAGEWRWASRGRVGLAEGAADRRCHRYRSAAWLGARNAAAAAGHSRRALPRRERGGGGVVAGGRSSAEHSRCAAGFERAARAQDS